MRWWLALVLLAGCSTPLADHQENGEAELGGDSLYAWRTNATGALVHDVSLRSGGGWCQVLLAGTGATPDYSRAMAAVIEADRRILKVSSGQQGLVEPHASVQALGAEHHVAGGRAWADTLGGNFTTEPGNLLNVTLAAIHLDGSAPPFWAQAELDGASAMMTIRCQRPFDLVHAYTGTEVVVFSETTFSGGASAHAHGIGDTGVQAVNSVGLQVSGRGWLYLDHRGDLLLQHLAAGAITIRTPAGEHLMVDHPAALALAITGLQSLQYEVESGPGRYEVEVTYGSVDLLGDVTGFIIGRPDAP